MTLAAEAPDLDVFWGFKGPVYAFAHHRGFTHSFLGLILVSAVVTGFMYLVWRLRGRKTNTPNLPPRWGLLFLFAYIAGLSHILLDYTNNYGVRPFWPFWEKWYSWGVAFILEPPMLVLLLAALVLPVVWPRRRQPHAFRGSLAARVALICILGLWLWRGYEAQRIAGALRGETFNSEAPLRVSAYPYWTRVSGWRIGLRWSAIIETRSAFVISDVVPSTRRLDESEKVVLQKPPETPETLAARRSYVGRAYLDWAQYPLLSVRQEGRDSVVHFRDLRFGYPQMQRNSLLTASVTLDGNLNVIGEAMGPRPQIPPID